MAFRSRVGTCAAFSLLAGASAVLTYTVSNPFGLYAHLQVGLLASVLVHADVSEGEAAVGGGAVQPVTVQSIGASIG